MLNSSDREHRRRLLKIAVWNIVMATRSFRCFEERSVDQLDVDAPVLNSLTIALAISSSLRGAASGSANWFGSTNFVGSG